MGEDQRREDLLGTTDCLEAIGVFKAWKNFLFVVAAICLVLLQICFWLVDADVIKSGDANAPQENAPVARCQASAGLIPLSAKIQIEVPDDVIAKAAAQSVKEVKVSNGMEETAAPQAAETNQPQKPAATVKANIAKALHIKFEHIAWVIRVCNYVLIFVVTLYCLVLLFCLKISLLARLGGVNHISRAFLLSLVALVLVLPWQKVFGFPSGLIFTPDELVGSHASIQSDKIITIGLYYARFCGLWVLVMAVLVLSHIRSVRWAKATLRRLGVI